jgi:hypothetical protein
MEPGGSVPYSQEFAIRLYPKTDESIPRFQILFLEDKLKFYFSIYT